MTEKTINDFLKPGTISFLVYRHDEHCTAQDTQKMSDCICDPEVVLMDEEAFQEELKQDQPERMNRAARRRAEAETKKAAQKAAKSKAH